MQNTPVLWISTSFQMHAAPESWLNSFFSAVFNLFCSFKTFFSDFTAEINNTFLTFICFLLISAVKSLKKILKEQKRLITAEKSWSKYTTRLL